MTAPRSNASHDQNHVPTLMGVSTSDGTTPIPVEVDPTTGQLQVSSSGGGGGSDVQYTDGASTIAHPIGTIPVFDNAGIITAVSAAHPLPTTATITGGGDASAANQTTEISKLTSIDGKITAVNTGAVVVSSSALPTGAATSAKQPALGTAGSASSDVITVQGIASGTAQPVSGTVTANAGTNLNTSALALETGGNLAAIKADVDKIPSQGQALAAASTPVVLTAAQVTTLTPPTNTGYALDASLTTIDTDLKSNVTLHAGTNLIGKVGIDQTTPGTTNAVAATNLPTTVDVNSGNKSASTLRVVLATDQPALTNKLLVTPDSVALPANQSVNVSQINAVTPLMGNGVTGTGSQRVTISSDNTAFSVNANQGTAAALTAGWPVIGGELADTIGTFTNATQTTSVTTSSFDGYSTVVVSINGTYGTATGVFEVSDDSGTTWYSVNAARSDGSAVETGYTSLTNTGRMWTLSVSGADEFRVRSTAVASGTVNVRISVESMPTPEAATVSVYQATASNLNATVVGTGTFSVQTSADVPGTGATNLGKAEDAAHTTGDTGVFALGVRNDTLADTTNTNADYSQVSTDIKGRMMTAGAPRSLKGTAQVSLGATTSETTIIAATASTFHDVYGLILANTGATTTKVSIRDDTAGTVRAIIEVPTLETRGFMLPVDSALPQTAVNKNWTAQCGSATTALEVTAFYVSMV